MTNIEQALRNILKEYASAEIGHAELGAWLIENAEALLDGLSRQSSTDVTRGKG